MDKRFSVWVLEDDPGSQFVYREILQSEYALSIFSDIESFSLALQRGSSEAPHLIIADLRLPGGSFLDFLNGYAQRLDSVCPFFVVSSADDLSSLRDCFAQGASDYITKPFSRAELIVKIERVLLPTSQTPEAALPKLDAVSHTLSVGTLRSEVLTPKEFQIAAVLNDASPEALDRNEILSRVWGNIRVTPKAFDVHLFNLRKKILPIGLEVLYLGANHYRLAARSSAEATRTGE